MGEELAVVYAQEEVEVGMVVLLYTSARIPSIQRRGRRCTRNQQGWALRVDQTKSMVLWERGRRDLKLQIFRRIQEFSD